MTELPMTPGPPDSPPPPSVVVLGRFQPFHRGHAHMLEFADSWRLNNMPNASLVVAVGSSNRPENLRNPWTYSERSEMIYRWLESSSIRDTPIIVPIPDIDDPPNWVSHAELYHGRSGVFLSSDASSLKLYGDSGWKTIEVPMESRERFEGWRVRETARMMSTIDDSEAVLEVLTPTIPKSVLMLMLDNQYLRRLAFMGEGGEPVG
tara:strand:- start:1723 stop:2340 length:618 start_codon:yes stop_codon:yes gene_type:complete